jgi:hypothetical protein
MLNYLFVQPLMLFNQWNHHICKAMESLQLQVAALQIVLDHGHSNVGGIDAGTQTDPPNLSAHISDLRDIVDQRFLTVYPVLDRSVLVSVYGHDEEDDDDDNNSEDNNGDDNDADNNEDEQPGPFICRRCGNVSDHHVAVNDDGLRLCLPCDIRPANCLDGCIAPHFGLHHVRCPNHSNDEDEDPPNLMRY